MSPESCPNSHRLAAYSHGELPDDAAEAIADHLEQCPACEQTVRDLEREGNTLIGLLRAPLAADPILTEAECERSVSGLRKSHPTLSLRALQTAELQAISGSPPLGMIRDYELLEQLGEGGMGKVFKARHRKLKRLVALKILPTSKLDAAAVARFEREMEAAGKMHHANIVGATDAGEHDGTHFLVMEYVEGRDLAKVIEQRGPLDVANACEIIRQAALGLQCAHEHGLVHRDIKPSNLMLAAPASSANSTTVKILDLGLALLFETHSPKELTNSGQVMGTLDYMAPEQVADAHRVDARADIYALGATLYKLLTGVAVYHGPAYTSAIQKLNALANVEAPPIQTVRPDVPAQLAALVHRMLAKDPAARPQSARETAELLGPFAAGHHLSALLDDQGGGPAQRAIPLHAAPYVAPPASAQPPIEAELVNVPKSRDRLRRLWIAVGGGLAALLVLAIVIPLVSYFARYAPGRPFHPNIRLVGPNEIAAMLVTNPLPGTSMYFQTTGATAGIVWGTSSYTLDSVLAAAAVHDGVLKPGEEGVLKITFEPGQAMYVGSTRNGVTSMNWGSFPWSYRLERSSVAEALAAQKQQQPASDSQVVIFTLTGSTIGPVWGTDIYSADSNLPTAAVHAGVLQPGQTARVKVTYLPGRDGYIGSTRHGVTSSNFSVWPRSMRFELAGADDGPATTEILSTSQTVLLSSGKPGQVHVLKIKGATQGAVWGTGVYTTDSIIETAAVHAGALKPGEIGVVKITLLPGQGNYEGSSRNGVGSYSWSSFPLSFRIERAAESDLPTSPPGTIENAK